MYFVYWIIFLSVKNVKLVEVYVRMYVKRKMFKEKLEMENKRIKDLLEREIGK